MLMFSFRQPWPVCLRLSLTLALLALLGLLALRASPSARVAQAAQRWDVQVSSTLPVPGGAIMTQGFFPSPLVVHAGDAVTWTWASNVPHTVTFNSGKPALPLIVPGPGPGELTLGPAFAPLGPAGPNAIYDGSLQLSSGVPASPDQNTYQLTFTQPGIFGYVCQIHPGMRGEIIVLPAGASLPETPAQATARGKATVIALAGAMQADTQQVRSTHTGSAHSVNVGIANGYGVSMLGFAPRELTVTRGDTILWTLADPFELHTVTLTSGAQPPEFVDVRPQPQGAPWLVVPASVAGPAGGTTYIGQGYVNSGILTPGNAFGLVFDAPPGTYEYTCLIHPEMQGTITVTS
jgi:plastocyanin